MILRGKVWKFGDHVNTDDIIAARYLNTVDENELAAHCMETAMPGFSKSISRGDFIVAGQNFGCGSSREHAPIAIKACGISVVVAKSFARIFFRNAINIGLPIVELPQTDEISSGDVLEIDIGNGILKNISTGRRYTFHGYPGFLQEIITTGGLMPWIKERHIKSE